MENNIMKSLWLTLLLMWTAMLVNCMIKDQSGWFWFMSLAFMWKNAALYEIDWSEF